MCEAFSCESTDNLDLMESSEKDIDVVLIDRLDVICYLIVFKVATDCCLVAHRGGVQDEPAQAPTQFVQVMCEDRHGRFWRTAPV